MIEILHKRAKSKSASFDQNSRINLSGSLKPRLVTSKDPDFIYKSAFSQRKRPQSDRARSNDKSLCTMPVQDEILGLKQTINKQLLEITHLKTQVQYTQNEYEKHCSADVYSDISHITKIMNSQKKMIQELKEEIKKKDEKIDEIKKMSKYCQIKELEAEVSYLTEECKKLMKALEGVSNERNSELIKKNQEEDIQKSILIAQLKKEKDRFMDSLEEKNQEILKWRDRVLELENQDQKSDQKLEKKYKAKVQFLKKQIKDLKLQLESEKKNSVKLENNFQEKIAKVQLEVITEKHSPKSKPISDDPVFISKSLKALSPIPSILELVIEKTSKENITLEIFFNNLTLIYSNYPKVEDVQAALDTNDSTNFIVEELSEFFSSVNRIPVVLFKDFCQKAKFTPVSIQKILQHLSLRLQCAKVKRENIKEIFPKALECNNLNQILEVFTSPPISLDKAESKKLFEFLYPQGTEEMSRSQVIATLTVRLEKWTTISNEDDELYASILGKLVEDYLEQILTRCKELDTDKDGIISKAELLKTFERSGIKLEKGLEKYIIIESYAQSREIDKVDYLTFLNHFNTISSISKPEKIVEYYLNQISSELCRHNLSAAKVFKNKKNRVKAEDFLDGLNMLNLSQIHQSHLSLIMESLQLKSSDNLCIDYSLFLSKLSENPFLKAFDTVGAFESSENSCDD